MEGLKRNFGAEIWKVYFPNFFFRKNLGFLGFIGKLIRGFKFPLFFLQHLGGGYFPEKGLGRMFNFNKKGGYWGNRGFPNLGDFSFL